MHRLLFLSRRLCASGVCALALLLLPWSSAALANIGTPWQAGDPVGEPVGALSQIGVEHEDLQFDLRPVADGGKAHVAASYALRNSGAPANLQLLFVAPGLQQGTVSLDGASVAAERVQGAPMPPSWQAPTTTPNPDPSGGDLPYKVQNGVGLRFQAMVPSGAHTLAVRYDLQPSAYSASGSMYRAFQVGYVLSPAREWASFGTLDVQAQVPPGWQASASPPLDRQGDVLQGQFNGLPADTLGLTVRRGDDALSAGWLLPLLALLVGAAVVWALGRRVAGWTRRHGWPLGGRLLVALVYVGLGGLGVGLLALFAQVGWLGLLPQDQLSNSWSYGQSFATLGYFLAGLLLGGLAGLLAFVRFRRRAPAVAAV